MKKSMKFKKRWCNVGFTLVELVITIAIIIILSVISVPIYRGYIDKAKWSEAYALLGTFLSAQKAYYAEYGNFLVCRKDSLPGSGIYTSREPVLGVDARSNKYFTLMTTGSSYGDTAYNNHKIYFDCGAVIPEELRTNSKHLLMLIYNISTGSRYSNEWW